MTELAHNPSRRTVWLTFFGFVLACFAVSAIGGAVTATSVGTWYRELNKPGFTPPDGVFAPVWTTLYAMMAVAAWRVWRRVGFAGGRNALTLFGVQLAFNLAWSFLFFGFQAIGWAFAEILLLWGLILATIRVFVRIDRAAGLLLVPYLLWVTYAAALTGTIWHLN